MSIYTRERKNTQALGQRVLDNEEVLSKRLDEDSRTLNSIRRYRIAEAKKAGCKGCRSGRLLDWLANEVKQLAEPEKSTVREVVDKS